MEAEGFYETHFRYQITRHHSSDNPVHPTSVLLEVRIFKMWFIRFTFEFTKLNFSVCCKPTYVFMWSVHSCEERHQTHYHKMWT